MPIVSRDLRGRSRRLSSPDRAFSESVFLIDNLTGGLDLNSAQSLLAPNRARILRNFSLSEPATLTTFPGFELFADPELDPGRILGGQRVYLAGKDPFTLVSHLGKIHLVADADGTFTLTDAADVSVSNESHFVFDRRVVQVFDGANRPQISSDGENWFTSGIDAPTTAPDLALDSGGSLIDGNTYEVSYTYATTPDFDPDLVHEGNGSPVETIVIDDSSGQSIKVDGARSTDPKVNRIRIYARNVTTGQTVRRRVGDVANPGAGDWTFTFSTEPSELALEQPVNHNIPEAFAFGVFWRNRWWARHPTVTNRWHFSQVFQPQVWPATFFIDLPMERGDDIVAVESIGDTLNLFGQTGIFLIVGRTSLDFEVFPALAAETGAFGPRAVKRVEGGIVHAGNLGVYLFDGASDRSISLDLERGWRDLVQNTSPAALSRIAVAYLGRDKQVNVSVPRVFPTGNPGEYVIDLIRTRQEEREAWTTTDRNIGGYIFWGGNEPATGNVERIFSWPQTNVALLHEERVGVTANGQPFQAEYEGPAFSSQLRETMVIQGFVEFQPANGVLSVDLVVDGQVVSTQTINLGEALSLYGTALYGTAVYGGAVRQRVPLMWPLDAEGSNISIKLRYSGTSAYRHFSYGFSLVPEAVVRSM